MSGPRRHGAALVALATIGIAAAGCSPPGELMLAIDTDMAPGGMADFDTIAVEVRNGTELKFSNAYHNLGESSAEVLLPMTLGLVASDEPGDEIRIKVLALAGGDLGAPLVLREVVTTIPEDRVALLRVPLHFLCDGSATTQNGEIANAVCAEGQTCVAGACVSNAVASEELPDYAPEDVYGGGTADGGGDCFDVAKCFAGSTDATLDLTACTIAVEGDVNVALRTPSTGICDGPNCFVALDAGGEAGFTVAGGKAQLPAAVCALAAMGKVTAVATAPATAECPQKTVGLPTCGPWSAAGR